MGDVAYRAEILIERQPGGLRLAHLPGAKEPVRFGTHGAIAAHYGRAPGTYQPHPTTIDHVIGATGG
jgi:hypothetical protein